MKKLFLKSLLFLLVILAMSACNENDSQKEDATTWCVLLDITGVRQVPEIRQEYADIVGKVLDKIKPGDALVIAYISESSINEISFLTNKRFPVFKANSDNELLIKGAHKKFTEEWQREKSALKSKLIDFILNDKRMASNTDIFSALHLAANVFQNYNDPQKKLIILSDMIQYTPEYDFYKTDLNDNEIENIIGKEKEGPAGLPRLDGAEVYVIGALSRNSKEFFKVKKFWQSFLRACNARISDENYGASLISL